MVDTGDHVLEHFALLWAFPLGLFDKRKVVPHRGNHYICFHFIRGPSIMGEYPNPWTCWPTNNHLFRQPITRSYEKYGKR